MVSLAVMLATATATATLSAQEAPPPAAAAPGEKTTAPALTPPPPPHEIPNEPLLNREAVLAKAAGVTAEKFPDAETVLVDQYVRNWWNETGAHTTLDEEYVKILTEEGRREAREKSFSHNVFYGGMEILAVEVIKPDGKVIKHEPSKISKEQVDRSQMSANIFDPNDRVTMLAIPELEIGDMTRLLVKRWEAKTRMTETYSDWSVLESTSPIVSLTYEMIGPESKPLLNKALLGKMGDSVKYSEAKQDGKVHYKWEAKDVPQIFPEPGMPDYWTVGQRLLVSTVADWKDVSKWYWNISKDHLAKITPEIKAKVSSLVAGCNTDEERIKAIFKFVSQEIRYMGITTEKEAPGYEPHDINITFENRYGVCRDKAALLASMLNEAGMKAYPVLIHNGNKMDKEVPTPFFNHAITAVRNSTGGFTLMDSTDENTADLLPQYLQNKSFLVATPEGETLMTSPVTPASENMAKATTEVKVAEDGSATGHTRILFEGINDNIYRGHLAKAKPDDIRRLFERSVKNAVPGGVLTNLKVEPENMMDTAQKLVVTMDFTVPTLLVAGGGTAQLDLPYVGSGIGMVGRMLGSSLSLEKRRFPLDTGITCGVREDLTVELPKSLQDPLVLPEYKNTTNEDFSLNQAITVEAGKLKASTELLLNAVEISPARYLELKQAMARLEVNSRQEPIFARKAPSTMPPPVADVEVLHASSTWRVEDAHTWTTTSEAKNRILTFAGKKDNAELQFEYNPAISEITLEMAEVTQKDGTVRKVKPEEMNILDAGWNASAPRYPGGKTLVVSLPGVEVDSVVHYRYVRKDKGQPFFNTELALASFDRIKELTYTFDLPEGLPFRSMHDLPAGEAYSEKVAEGRRILTLRAQNLQPISKESGTPPTWVDMPDFIGSAGNWEAWIKHLKEAFEKNLVVTDVVKAKATELTSKAETPLARIQALRDFVSMQIRGEGPSFLSLPQDKALTPAEMTLKDGYGHSADRAILLCALLKAAGMEAELALAARGLTEERFTARALSFPSEGYYGSVVCRVKNPAQAAEWLPLDVLSQYAPVGATYLHDMPGRTLDNETFTWKAPEGLKNDVRTHLDIVIDTEGTAQLKVSTRYHGASQDSFVQRFKEMTPEEFSRYHQGLISGLSQNATATSKLHANYDYPGTQEYSASIKHFAIKAGQSLYFDLPSVPGMIFVTDAESRKRPWMNSSTIDSKFTWQVTLPGGLKPAILPENIDWAGPGGLGTVQFRSVLQSSADKSTLDVEYEAHLRPAILPAGNYADLLRLNQTFRHGSRRRVLLTH